MRREHELLVRQNAGQMSVELAVMLPVILVVALTIANIMAFLNACARFDRACLDAVIAQGVSPASMQSELSAVGAVQDSLEEVFENREQIEISRYYEKLPKPTLLATEEFIDNQVYFRDPSKDKIDEA